MAIKTGNWEAENERLRPVEILYDNESIFAFLMIAAEREDKDYLVDCISDAMRARAINQLATEAGIDRQMVYELLSGRAKPNPVAVAKIQAFLGASLPRAEIGA